MKQDKEKLILVIIVFLLIIINVINVYQCENNLAKKDNVINLVNEARIRAENKECCQLIQERYNDKRISEDGLMFIYEEHPQIIECE